MQPRRETDPETVSTVRVPSTCVSKSREPIVIRRFDEQDRQELTAMYLAFRPRNSFQGLPPLKDAACLKWVEQMIATGIGLVAVSRNQGIVAHCVLFPIDRQVCEMLIVVSPPFQNSGIGTQLIRSCAGLATELGFERIWLPVQANNVRARHVYKKCGFQYVPGGDARELEMALCLRPSQPPAALGAAPLAAACPPLDLESGVSCPSP
jgi:RimJ/RimL family protein N-acetyltransferase